MTTEDLRAAITSALRRRDPNADLDVTPSLTLLGSRTSTASVVIYGHDGAVIDVVARAGDDAKALRGVAFAVGLLDDGSDPAEEVERYRTIAGNLLARIHRDGGHHADAIGWERAADEADMIVARLFVERDATHAASARDDFERAVETQERMTAERERDETRAEVDRLRADLALERERCAGLVRELTAAPPGSRRTAASRNLAERVAACVRDILRDDETATCARSLVREARERAKAAESDAERLHTDNARLDDVARGALDDLARMRAELDATREALRAHLFCDECEELATRCHAESASFGCDAHGVGDGWRDTTHADAVRAAGGVR